MAEHGARALGAHGGHARIHGSLHRADFAGHGDKGLAAQTGGEAQFDEMHLTGLGRRVSGNDAGCRGAGFNAAESIDAGTDRGAVHGRNHAFVYAGDDEPVHNHVTADGAAVRHGAFHRAGVAGDDDQIAARTGGTGENELNLGGLDHFVGDMHARADAVQLHAADSAQFHCIHLTP